MSPKRPYHHGDLRPVLLAAAIDIVEESGAAALSMREVARRAGVSHTAATYHFGDKAGLLGAIAADGYRRIAATLSEVRERGLSFLDMGVAYVHFAVTHPAHFEVMYHPALYDARDPDVVSARQDAAELLYGSRDASDEQLRVGVAAWSLVHGFATLWLAGALPPELGRDPEGIARAVASYLSVPRERA